ncbi:hypothetical protein ACFY5K_25610 [Streptomyces griseofuscus]|uniref:hypothetical protein n=1 Tax=Streptomyces griseofuscus TaxID=146922 RepID=UPI0036960710
MESLGRYEAMAYGPIGKEVIASQPFTEADPIGVHAAILALFSAALNGHVTQSGGRPIVCWTCLVGRSGGGAKGTALEAAEHILGDALGDFLYVHRRMGISSGPSLINVLYEQYTDSLATEGGPDGRILVVEEEWQTQLRRTSRCPSFPGVFRTAWDGKTVANTTKGKRVGEREEQKVDEPLMGFHAHIQPGVWKRYISATEALGGTFNRILAVNVEMARVLPEPENGEDRPIFSYEPSKALKLAYDWARKEKRVMTMSTAARRRYDQLRLRYLKATAELPEVEAAFFERSAEQVKRVAGVLTAANRKTLIPREAIDAAAAFVDYSIESVRGLMADAGAGTGKAPMELDERIRKTLRKYGGEMRRAHLGRALGAGRFSSEEIDAELEAMPDIEVEEEERDVKRSGAKPRIVRLLKQEGEEKGTVPAQTREPVQASTPVPALNAADAETLLTLYADWASKEANAGKSLSDFLAAMQPPVEAPAPKAPAKRSTAPRKASGSSAEKTAVPRPRGTAAKKSTATKKKTAPKSPAKKAVSARGAKKTVTATPVVAEQGEIWQ